MDKDTAVTLLILFIGISIFLYVKLKKEKADNKKLAESNAKLQADKASLEADHLKFQLHPHTLNNILADLKLTANKVNKGLDAFSDTLEYILYKGNNHFVSVQDELNFIRQYIKVRDLFITELDSIMLDDSQINKSNEHFSKPCIPHLITGYFIENAFKHGDKNHKEFLKIKISLSQNQFLLLVVNKTNKVVVRTTGGLGLNNMKRRLELLVPGKFEINSSLQGDEFHSTLAITISK